MTSFDLLTNKEIAGLANMARDIGIRPHELFGESDDDWTTKLVFDIRVMNALYEEESKEHKRMGRKHGR